MAKCETLQYGILYSPFPFRANFVKVDFLLLLLLSLMIVLPVLLFVPLLFYNN